MKPHTKIYLKHFHEPFCEVCGAVAVDIHHIWSRGSGGKDRIENLMALCRKHHTDYGDKKQWKAWLMRVHLQTMRLNQIKFDERYCDQFYNQYAAYNNTDKNPQQESSF